jgi:hypothetical protein
MLREASTSLDLKTVMKLWIASDNVSDQKSNLRNAICFDISKSVSKIEMWTTDAYTRRPDDFYLRKFFKVRIHITVTVSAVK